MIRNKQTGFTIVELLIVIVVIGILAAISIVAYTGVQGRAQAAAASSALEQVSRKLALYTVDNNAFPADLATAGINSTSSTTYQYTVNNSGSPQTYCVTATNGSTSYKASSTATTPSSGSCAGHGAGGVPAITNLEYNPSFENGINADYSSYNGAPRAVVSTGCFIGAQCSSVDTSAGANRGLIAQLGAVQTTNVPYVYSAYVKGPAGQSVEISARPTDVASGYVGEGAGAQSYTLSSSWQQISTLPVTLAPAGPRPGFQIRASTGNVSPFLVDAVMITQGNTVYGYADGNSANWVWNGAINNSTSTGPPL